jgi:hypothetical protein
MISLVCLAACNRTLDTNSPPYKYGKEAHDLAYEYYYRKNISDTDAVAKLEASLAKMNDYKNTAEYREMNKRQTGTITRVEAGIQRLIGGIRSGNLQPPTMNVLQQVLNS